MDQKIKSLWIKALRSGKYKQTDSVLRDGNGAMCCLGVLGLIQGVPPEELKGKLSYDIPRGLNGGLRKASRKVLGRMNDAGKTFHDIAAYIAKRY